MMHFSLWVRNVTDKSLESSRFSCEIYSFLLCRTHPAIIFSVRGNRSKASILWRKKSRKHLSRVEIWLTNERKNFRDDEMTGLNPANLQPFSSSYPIKCKQYEWVTFKHAHDERTKRTKRRRRSEPTTFFVLVVAVYAFFFSLFSNYTWLRFIRNSHEKFLYLINRRVKKNHSCSAFFFALHPLIFVGSCYLVCMIASSAS